MLKMFNLVKLTLTFCTIDYVCFQFCLFIYNFDLSSFFFKWNNLVPLKFETKLIIKLNYNLYIHIKSLKKKLYIKSLHLNIQIILFLYFYIKIISFKFIIF